MPEAPGHGGLILDTHIWLWVVEGARARLSESAIREIEDASRRGEVLISAISVWEVAMLEAKGRISLARPLREWIRAALRAPGARLLELTPEIATESARLPGGPHGDPADRILAASARVLGGRLATCNTRLIDYSAQGHLAVLDCRP
jgi:PIN domain nuclease of toxin-antitoxin system